MDRRRSSVSSRMVVGKLCHIESARMGAKTIIEGCIFVYDPVVQYEYYHSASLPDEPQRSSSRCEIQAVRTVIEWKETRRMSV